MYAQAGVLETSERLERGLISSEELVSECLRRIEDPESDGSRTIIRRNPLVLDEARRADADRAAAMRRGLRLPSPLHGIPVTVKDLFDIEGQVTTAGSRVLQDAPPAERDSQVVARLRDAGMLILGTTNMTEFAFSGVGLNPHFGTPSNPHDRQLARIPGGSSSGAAVSVADGMATVALGTDTRGSCRIPAALCGLVGFKATARRVSTAGCIPLSTSLDSIGSLGRRVACCALVDAAIANECGNGLPAARDLSGVRVGRLINLVEDEVEASVASAYEGALSRLEAAGARIRDLDLRALDILPELLEQGGIAGAQAYAWHRDLIEKRSGEYDPRVASRILAGRNLRADELAAKLKLRARMVEQANLETGDLDLVAFPSVPLTAPPVASLAQDDEYMRINMLMLRNPGIVNFLDRCAISLPIPQARPLPMGLMLMGESMTDRELLALSLKAEAALAG